MPFSTPQNVPHILVDDPSSQLDMSDIAMQVLVCIAVAGGLGSASNVSTLSVPVSISEMVLSYLLVTLNPTFFYDLKNERCGRAE